MVLMDDRWNGRIHLDRRSPRINNSQVIRLRTNSNTILGAKPRGRLVQFNRWLNAWGQVHYGRIPGTNQSLATEKRGGLPPLFDVIHKIHCMILHHVREFYPLYNMLLDYRETLTHQNPELSLVIGNQLLGNWQWRR